MVRLLWNLAFLWAVLPVGADEVLLVDGGRIEGRVVETGDRYVVETRPGRVAIPGAKVAGWTRIPTDLETCEERRRAVADDDADGLFRLAVWCEERGLSRHARSLYERVTVLQPEHEGARRALGYRRVQGRWVTEDEFWSAQGYTRFRGRWVSPAEADLWKAQQEERRQDEREAAEERRRKREEAGTRRAEAARDAEFRARLQRARQEEASRTLYDPRPRYGGSSVYTSPFLYSPGLPYPFPRYLLSPYSFCGSYIRTGGRWRLEARFCF